MVGKGLRAHIGAHGEPPLGLNYHAEVFFAQSGGLSNYQVSFSTHLMCPSLIIFLQTLRAATSDAAETFGMASSIGSLAQGKLADYLIYPAGVDLLDGDVASKAKDPRFVVRGGRIWEASTMEEVWPRKGRKQQIPPFNAD
jgi:hypothetical protein